MGKGWNCEMMRVWPRLGVGVRGGVQKSEVLALVSGGDPSTVLSLGVWRGWRRMWRSEECSWGEAQVPGKSVAWRPLCL